ncbi:MAG: peroxiredoxin [Candidatus Acidiferrales bacterium]
MPQPHHFSLPSNLPRPVDDGATDHLKGTKMPAILLPSTAGRMVDLSALPAPRTVIYCYPRTGVPGEPLPEGWDMIPGARGCTPQSCGFRDLIAEFRQLSTDVFGFSTQTTAYQREASERLHLPFEILSDPEFKSCTALRLPMFEVQGMRLVKRVTLIVRNGQIEHVFYPVFPPNESAEETSSWLRRHPIASV